jgi:5'-deoxynucleotidase YfbR-like HD superfamily hydrolase
MSITKELLGLIQGGNDVTRWHTIPSLRPQTVASHSWGVAMMAMSLFDGKMEDKLLLVEAALEHDLAEKVIGDIPRPSRDDSHKILEEQVAVRLGILHESLLPPHLKTWLEWADLIEAGLQAHREVNMGNKNYEEVVNRVREYLDKGWSSVPIILLRFAEDAKLTVKRK